MPEKAASSGKREPVEQRLHHLDEKETDADVSAFMINHRKKPAVMFVLNDTSQLKKARSRSGTLHTMMN